MDTRRLMMFGIDPSVPLRELAFDYLEGTLGESSNYNTPFSNGILKIYYYPSSASGCYIYVNNNTAYNAAKNNADFAMFMFITVSDKAYSVHFSNGSTVNDFIYSESNNMLGLPNKSSGQYYISPGYGYNTDNEHIGSSPYILYANYGNITAYGSSWGGTNGEPFGIYCIIITKTQMAETLTQLYNQMSS